MSRAPEGDEEPTMQLTIDGDEVRLDIAECGCDPKAYGPPPDPSPRCESGKRPHCSCDTCF